MPNPKKTGELVTVQIFSMWAFGYANPDHSIDQMKKEGLDPAKQMSPYILKDLDNIGEPELFGLMKA